MGVVLRSMIWILGVLGLVIGSFLNVLIWRLNDEKAPKFWQGRSLCPKCKHTLSWRDNIPLLSFILLAGKCRYCRKPISLQYPVVELTTAVVTILVGFGGLSDSGELRNLSWTLGTLAISWAFIVIFFADWIYGLIPDEMEVVIVVVTILRDLSDLRILGQNALVGVVCALAFFLVVLATKFRGMGLGDVKLAFVMGFLLGFPGALVAFWSSFLLGGAYAMALLLLKRRKFHDTIALGPFLVIGTVVAVLWSRQILQIVGL